MLNFLQLSLGMLFILLSAMMFCNALEHLGSRLGISEGVTGSIFVAVGTALPETLIPLIALFAAPVGATIHGENEIGVGAILGPPLMLSTLSIALMAFSVLKKRGLYGIIRPEKTGLNRDLKFFSFGYLSAILLAFSHNYYVNHNLDLLVVITLILSYFFYVLLTIRASSELVKDGHVTVAENRLILAQYLRLSDKVFTIFLQILLSLAGLVYFAKLFIAGISATSQALGIPMFLLAVVLIPIATELPEKVNSILWIRKGKDSLAFANITGAMVFQGLLLPVMGILLTSWQLPSEKAISCIATFIAVGWLFVHSAKHRQFKVWHFSINGLLYIISLILSLWAFN